MSDSIEDLGVRDRHVVFPTDIQTHALQKPLAAGDPKSEFELSLKVAAILTRGVIISDSDLNNNTLLHGLVEPGTTFHTALEAGFVRRAVRMVDGGPASQAQVAEHLRINSLERFRNIPDGHVAALDAALDAAERSDGAPLTWTFPKLGQIFAHRLLKILDDERQNTRGQEPIHSLLSRTVDWIRAERASGRQINAAALEHKLRPEDADAASAAAWDRVFSLVLASYNGNIPAALNLSLADSVASPLRFLPSGPESMGNELSTELALYNSPIDEGALKFRIERREIPIPDILEHLTFDLDKLAAIDIRELIGMREESSPDAFFDVRHQTLGSSVLLESLLPTLLERAAEFVERFVKVSHVLTGTATASAIRARLDDSLAREGRMHAFFLTSDDKDFLVEQLMCFISNSSVVPAQVAMCDLTVMRAYRPDFDQLAPGLVDRPVLAVSRPDYRVIQTIGEELLVTA